MAETHPEPVAPLLRELAGAALRNRRTAVGERLVDVAERAGISPQYLSEIERGVKDPSSEMLTAVAEALGLGLDDLLVDVARGRGLHLVPQLSTGRDPAVPDRVHTRPRTDTIDPICLALAA